MRRRKWRAPKWELVGRIRIDPHISMRRLLVISRLLALFAFLGLTPVWAMEDGCCCGTGQSICEMPPERPELTSAEVSDLLGLRLFAGSKVASATSGVCAPGGDDDCACWRPFEAPGKLAVAENRPGRDIQWGIVALPVTLVPRALPKADVPLINLPWRPPILGLAGWSHALFPVPPPHLS